MKKCGILNYIIILLALVTVLTPAAFCQSDTLSKFSEAPPVKSEPDTCKHSLYAGIGAGSNMIYLGTSLSNNKPFYSASVTYAYRNALFVSASGSHLSETTPYLAFYNLAMNYSHTFNSWFDISADLALYKTALPLQDSLFSDFAYINLTTGFDWKLIYTRLSFAGIMSVENGFYMQISNSRYFETPEFFNGKALIYFDPAIDILFGNLISVETVSGSKKYGGHAPFSHGWGNQGGPTESYSEKFGLMDFQFSMPVTFSYGKFSLEAEASYLLPVYSDPYYPEQKGFTFYLNLLFKIF